MSGLPNDKETSVTQRPTAAAGGRPGATRSSLFSGSAKVEEPTGFLSGAHPLVWIALAVAILAVILVLLLRPSTSEPETPLATAAEIASVQAQLDGVREDLAQRSERLDQLATLISAVDQRSLPELRESVRNLQSAFQLTDRDLLQLKRTVDALEAAPRPGPAPVASLPAPAASTPATTPTRLDTPPSSEPDRPLATAGTYTIRPGDTLWHVASRLGVALDDLLAINPELDPRRLRPGMVINVPAR
ncbi:MAG: LysM peptidoglycan-binding domain-containing protein [Opitutales bacterium]